MPLFSKSATTFRDGVKDLDSDRFKHLEKIINTGKAVGRAPEMAGTTIVFMPYPDFDNPNYKAECAVLPDRLSDDPMDYGRWLFYADGVAKFGKNPVTILFDDPDDSGFVPSEHNPVHMIYDAVDRALHAGQVIETPFGSSESDKWEQLLKGDRKNKVYPVISRPDQLVMAYALIYSSGKKSYIMEGAPFGAAAADPPVVFVMGRYMATKSLVPQLDATGPDGKILYPEVTGQRFVHFYDRQKNDCPAMRNAISAQQTALGGVRRQMQTVPGAEQAATQLAGYGVFMSDTYTGMPDAPKLNRRDVARLAVQKLRPWQETLRGHTPEAAARLISDYCGLPLSVLYYAWKSMPSYYGEELKQKLRNPVSVEMRHGPAAGLGIPTGATFASATGTAPHAHTDLDDPIEPGDAPWGGNINDRPGEAGTDFGDGPPPAPAEAAYDQAEVAAAQAKLKAFMAAQQTSAAGSRSAAAKGGNKPAGGK